MAVDMEGNDKGLFWMILCIKGRAASAVPSTTSMTTKPSILGSLCKGAFENMKIVDSIKI